MKDHYHKIQSIFATHFPQKPSFYFSPGRINLIGEHIDYNDGYVMPAAIDKGVYFAIAPNDSMQINLYAADFDEHFSINLVAIKKDEGWKNYLLSVINEFQALGKSIRGFNCVLLGDIPQGSGLSSSAAVEGGLAFALNELFCLGHSRKELALLSQRAEHNFPGVNCGIMDQYANMLGAKGQVLLLDCKYITHQYFPLLLEDYRLVLVNSKVSHSLATSAYNERRQQCEAGLKIIKEELNIQSFRDVGDWQTLLPLQDSMGSKIFRRCKYVIQEIERTLQAADLLKAGRLYEFGQLMYQTHAGLSELYEVSCLELDFLVEVAISHPAVIGSRMMGGGFGGCTINLVHKDYVQVFSEKALAAYQDRFNIKAEIYQVETGDGVRNMEG